MRKPFIPTDFPEAVCPATSKCGIFVKSPITRSQLTSFPIAIGISIFLLAKAGDSRTSLSPTVCLSSFGTSIPTTPSPGIGAWIRIDFACRASVRSFLRFSIFWSLTPSFGLSLYWITVGPTLYPSIPTWIQNWRSFSSISISFRRTSFSSTLISDLCCIKSLVSGKSQFPKLFTGTATCFGFSSQEFPKRLENPHFPEEMETFSGFLFSFWSVFGWRIFARASFSWRSSSSCFSRSDCSFSIFLCSAFVWRAIFWVSFTTVLLFRVFRSAAIFSRRSEILGRFFQASRALCTTENRKRI